MSEALQALYRGDLDEARRLLEPDDELSVFDVAAFGRVRRLREILAADPTRANARAEGDFTALDTARENGDEELVRLLLERGAES